MVLSEEEVVNRLSEWIGAEVKKKDIRAVLWAIAKARIDASVMGVIRKIRREEAAMHRR